VYARGQKYFGLKVAVERNLDVDCAHDLAGESLVEFQKSWKHVRFLDRYTRRMFRNNLVRHLTRSRKRKLREPFHEDVGIRDPDTLASDPKETVGQGQGQMSDYQLRQLRTATRRLCECDSLTRTILSFRVAAEPMTYREIEQLTGMKEAALRMRMARFCRSVRVDFESRERGQDYGSHN
jgi:DNA-directed RNA polymerase specialized sigma24 family protein